MSARLTLLLLSRALEGGCDMARRRRGRRGRFRRHRVMRRRVFRGRRRRSGARRMRIGYRM